MTVTTLLLVAALITHLGAICLSIMFTWAACRWEPAAAAASEVGREQTATVIVPALGRSLSLERCLKALSVICTGRLEKVVVALQAAPAGTVDELNALWTGPVPLHVIDMGSDIGKSRGIIRSLEAVSTEWVILVDADVEVLPQFIDILLPQSRAVDAVYGVITSVRTSTGIVLDRVVRADKAVSHGVWRVSRLALGLSPNIPGQCYAVRTSVLTDIYSDSLGHLDDLSVSLMLVGRGAKVTFVPCIVAAEECRSSWWGLLNQRARWSIGLTQAAIVAAKAKPHTVRSLCAWGLHAWLYHGWAVFVGVCAAAAFLASRPLFAFGFVASYGVIWSSLALIGDRNLQRLTSADTQIATTSAVLGSFAIMAAQIGGLLLAPWLYLGSKLRLIGTSALYVR